MASRSCPPTSDWRRGPKGTKDTRDGQRAQTSVGRGRLETRERCVERAATANGTRAAAVVGRRRPTGCARRMLADYVYTHLRSRSMEERHAASESRARHNWSDDGVNKNMARYGRRDDQPNDNE